MASQESKTIKLYIAEDQEIYRVAYKSIFASDGSINLLGISNNGNLKALKDAVSALNPEVLLMSARQLDRSVIEELKQVREDCPRMGIVLLLVSYNAENMRRLRNLTSRNEAGIAIFSKQSLERIDQLRQIIISVSEGHTILDPALTNLLFTEKHNRMFLKGFTCRELEILSLVAQGYTNSAIAETLYIDIKTVRHHMNNMYSKLKADTAFDRKHPRVRAARLYLESSGELLTSRMSAR